MASENGEASDQMFLIGKRYCTITPGVVDYTGIVYLAYKRDAVFL